MKAGQREFPNQLFINPNECIDFGHASLSAPGGNARKSHELFNDYIGLNYRMMDQPSEFIVQEHDPRGAVPEQVEANRAKGAGAMTGIRWSNARSTRPAFNSSRPDDDRDPIAATPYDLMTSGATR
jgi:hypothetical protein